MIWFKDKMITFLGFSVFIEKFIIEIKVNLNLISCGECKEWECVSILIDLF